MTDKDFMREFTRSVVGILICMAALAYSTWLWYSASTYEVYEETVTDEDWSM